MFISHDHRRYIPCNLVFNHRRLLRARAKAMEPEDVVMITNPQTVISTPPVIGFIENTPKLLETHAGLPDETVGRGLAGIVEQPQYEVALEREEVSYLNVGEIDFEFITIDELDYHSTTPREVSHQTLQAAFALTPEEVIEQISDLLLKVNIRRGSIVDRAYIFVDHYTLPNFNELSRDAQLSLDTTNAGGKSEISEMFSIDYMKRFYNSTETIFETQVSYWYIYKMVDFICTVNGHRVGVSVARAMGFPDPDKFTANDAKRIIYKKLYGIIGARNAVAKRQVFYRSIVHIWCQTRRIAELLVAAFNAIDDRDYGLNVKGTYILQLTVCEDPQIYRNYLDT